MYQTILFDLDGTLTDSGPGITNSVAYALNKYGVKVRDRRELNRFVGPPLVDEFMKYCGIERPEAEKLLAYYREYFTDRGMFENEVYDGIPELLSKLANDGKQIIVATSKPEPFAVKILEHFEISKYFAYIAGSTLDEKRTSKDEVIRYALDVCHVNDLSSVIMIGDREYDIIGAKAIGTDSIGVLYGYGSHEELFNAGATYIVEKVSDIYNFIK